MSGLDSNEEKFKMCNNVIGLKKFEKHLSWKVNMARSISKFTNKKSWLKLFGLKKKKMGTQICSI